MAPELLVDDLIEDGGRLVTALVRSGVDVPVAFWIRTQEEGLWFLYFAISTAARDGFADAYRTVYAMLSRLQIKSIELSQVKLIASQNPIASDAIAVRDRYPARIPTRLSARRLGGIAIDEGYIYPRTDQALTKSEVLQAITSLLNRSGPLSPSSVTLRDGSVFLATPVGIQISNSGNSVIITLHEHTTGKNRVVPVEDITAIQ